MISADGKTILTSLSIDQGDRTVKEMREDLNEALKSVNVEHYITGKGLIDEDTIESSQEGLKKSEYITVVFILLILFLVFRSFVAPFVPLLTRGSVTLYRNRLLHFWWMGWTSRYPHLHRSLWSPSCLGLVRITVSC